ncbi:glycosyltransferase [Bacillus sp. CGMCC 1.60114]|uniref:glycosyltransferase n=1 Tax=unclassified Bacillus (in: firmicutes) TaxID=185979 RepID=UPI00363E1758
MEKLNKIFFIVDMKEEQKTGLFNATYNRINSLTRHIDNYEIYSLREYDGKILSLLKKMFNKKVKVKLKEDYIYRGCKIKYFYMKNTILKTIFRKMGIYYPIFTALKMKKLVQGHQLINAHWGHPQGSVAHIVSKLLKIPYTITYHGSDVHSIPFENRVFSKNIKRNLKNSDLNIFVSENLKEVSIKRLNNPNKNNVVIPNGIDLNIYYELPPNEILQMKNKLELKERVVGFVGNLYEVKRADKLPEIFKQIQMSCQFNVEFIVIGDGEFKKYIEKKCKEYELNVLFMGKLEPKEVNKFMNIMDILIIPSRREAFGLVILEAHACGTIVIGSDAGGIPEVMGNDDFIVKDGKDFEKHLAQKVEYYLENDYDKNQLMKRVKSTYDLNIIAEKEYVSLQKVLNKSRKYNR